jgi:hypothetical protein
MKYYVDRYLQVATSKLWLLGSSPGGHFLICQDLSENQFVSYDVTMLALAVCRTFSP